LTLLKPCISLSPEYLALEFVVKEIIKKIIFTLKKMKCLNILWN